MKKQAAVLTALCLTAQLWVPRTWAESIEDKKSELEDVQQQMEEKDAQRESQKKVIASAVDRLVEAQNELAQAKKELAEVEGRQEALAIKIRQNEAALAAKQAEYKKTRAVYMKRLRDIYENGQVNYLDVLLGSADFRDFASRMYLLQRVIRRDFRLIDKLEAQRQELERQQAILAENKRELDALHQEVARKQQVVAEKTRQRQELYQQALAEKAKMDAEYAELQRNSEEIKGMIQRMEEEERQRAEAAAAAASAGGTGEPGWPVNGPITSPFGWRVHPIWGTQIFHAGIDIAADYGQPVHAADSGTVIYAGWLGGYGNAVMINHGGGMVTLYGHNSSFTVDVGEHVSRGQTIALAGSTGNSTGPHCHFEVRIHGEVTQPLSYLP